MKRIPVFVSFGFIAFLLVFAACVREVERDEAPTAIVLPATPVPTSTFTPVPPPTATPSPTLTPRPTLPPSATPPSTVEPVKLLLLEVRSPRDASTVRTDAVVVHGVTSPGAQVEVEGIAASVDADGRFQIEVTLAPGINTLRVVATDSQGNRETRALNVTSLALPPLPFLLLITEPEDQSIVSQALVRLSGRTGPEAITSVNGVSVSVDELGLFSTMITLEPGPNIIDVVATNNDGRILSTVIALIYRP